jgi:hypothetical protein
MKCALVEYNRIHGEILPTLIHVLNSLGIEVDLYVSRRIMKNDPFACTPGLGYRAGNSHGIRFKALVEGRGFAGYDFVVFNSLEPKRVLRKARAAKVPVLAVIHNGGLITGDPDYAAFFRDANHRPLVLARSVSEFLSGARPVPWITPVLVAEMPEEARFDDGPVRFCVQGNLAFDRRNYASLLDAVEHLAKNNRTNFVVTLIGRYRPDGARFHSQVAERGLKGFFEYAERGIDRFLEYAGRGIPYQQYYRFLGQSHFILPLVDRSSPVYRPYYEEKITSSLTVAIGMGLVPVIDAELAVRYSVESCSIMYETGSLADAMKQALDLGPENYQMKKHALDELRKELLSISRRNMEREIREITGSVIK